MTDPHKELEIDYDGDGAEAPSEGPTSHYWSDEMPTLRIGLIAHQPTGVVLSGTTSSLSIDMTFDSVTPGEARLLCEQLEGPGFCVGDLELVAVSKPSLRWEQNFNWSLSTLIIGLEAKYQE